MLMVSWHFLLWEPEGIKSACCLMIGQYALHLIFLPSSFYGENAMESISSKPPPLLSMPLTQDSPLPRLIPLCIPYTHAAMDSLVMGRRSHSHTVTQTGIRAIHFLSYLHYVDTMIIR